MNKLVTLINYFLWKVQRRLFCNLEWFCIKIKPDSQIKLTSYHSPKSVAVIQKGVVLRIRGISLSENEFSVKLEDYMAYLVMLRSGESKIRLY